MTEPLDIKLVKRLKRRRVCRVAMLGAFIFICGGLTGWAGSILCHRPRPAGEMIQPDPPVDDLVRRMREELLLSDAQTKKVTDIYKARESALKAIRDTMRPQLNAQYDQLRQQMKGALTPEQFDRWDKRFQNVRNRMLPPPPPRGGPGGPPDGGGWHGPNDGGDGGGPADDHAPGHPGPPPPGE